MSFLPAPGELGPLARGEVSCIRDYEAVYIIDPLLDEEQAQTIISKYSQIVADNGGEVVAIDKWDKRRLAYEVKGRTEGIYIVMNYKGEPSTSAELDRVMKLSEDCLRHIVVRDEIPPQPKPQVEAAPVAQEPAPEVAVEVEAEAEAAAEPEAEVVTETEAAPEAEA